MDNFSTNRSAVLGLTYEDGRFVLTPNTTPRFFASLPGEPSADDPDQKHQSVQPNERGGIMISNGFLVFHDCAWVS